MVLTKAELIGALQHEVDILLHLAGKLEPSMLDYRPTPKQRSALELLKYMTIMGPQLIDAARRGSFDRTVWAEAQQAAAERDFDQTVAAIAAQRDTYQTRLAEMSDDDLRGEIDMFGRRITRGAFLVTMVLGGCAAYRTQLFLYLKSCGRDELSTMNLWAGMDAPAAAAV
jgi:hypothetical protein